MKTLLKACIVILICLTASCIKNPIHLDLFPIKANPGKFECHINGKDFVPDSNRLRLAPGSPVMVYVDDWGGPYGIVIDTNTPYYANHDGQSIDLAVQHVTGTGTYEFDTPEHGEADYILHPPITLQNPPAPEVIYRLYTPGHGSLTVTRFDLKNKVIAGTFWFNAVNVNDPTDSVKVTGGHFNINYSTN